MGLKMSLIDWDLIWNNELVVSRRTRLNDKGFWDNQVEDMQFHSDYHLAFTHAQMDMMRISSEDRVLEIGPGIGRLTIPISKACSNVTVVEPSELMAERLKRELDKAAVDNVDIIVSTWEELNETDISEFDVIIASYSMFMPNISEQLRKMGEASSRDVYLFVSAEPRVPIEVQQIIHGSSVSSRMPDHQIIFNILTDMGIHCDIRIIEIPWSDTYDNLDDAVKRMMLFHDCPDEKITPFTDYVKSILREESGNYVRKRINRTALLTWKVE